MRTWQILPAADGGVKWIPSGSPAVRREGHRPDDPPETLAPTDESNPAPRLPSMTDIYLQARPKLLEVGNSGGSDAGAPVFCTGSGRTVSISKSSIQKARAVLEGTEEGRRDGDCGGQFQMFLMGSERSAPVSEGSIQKTRDVMVAKSIIKRDGHEDDCIHYPMFQTGSGRSVTVSENLIQMARTVLEERDIVTEDEGCGDVSSQFPMFQTGFGRSVSVSKSSIQQAKRVMGMGDIRKTSNLDKPQKYKGYEVCGGRLPFFQTGRGRSVSVSSSSVLKAMTILEAEDVKNTMDEENNCSGGEFPMARAGFRKTFTMKQSSNQEVAAEVVKKGMLNSCHNDGNRVFSDLPFQTSFRKLGNTYPSGLSRATTLLGLEEGQLGTKTSIILENANDRFWGDVNPARVGILDDNPLDIQPVEEVNGYVCSQPSIMFHTAGGRSVSVSSDALQRAKSLLGDSNLRGVLQNDGNDSHQLVSAPRDEELYCDISRDKENMLCDHLQECPTMNKNMSILSDGKHSCSLHFNISPSSATHKTKDDKLLLERKYQSGGRTSHALQPLYKDVSITQRNKAPGGPLVEISNHMGADCRNTDASSKEKKRFGRMNSVSPFKRPRISRFTTPLNNSASFSSSGKFVDRTVFNIFIWGKKQCLAEHLITHVPDEVKHMTADSAQTYKFHDASGIAGMGSEAFQRMLLECGASSSHATKQWVANHYKWIVWKLACLERCYPTKACGKYLTISNVLGELKYRYEREANFGHRSALKRVLEGDASPASMMVLCVSAIHTLCASMISKLEDGNASHKANDKLRSSTKIQLTDGWYSLEASIDACLSKQLLAGKLFIGQKLRIWGAALCGWVGPISVLEAPNIVSLLVHINGTYRARWDEPLGFCKVLGPPLAFKCIKGSGGRVPRTLVGIARIYPLLYKERFPNGGSTVRSERMEAKAMQLYQQRRSNISEDIVSDHQEFSEKANDGEEGAKILKTLENAADPEVVMAEMSSEQLISLSSYQARQENIRQTNLVKKIEKALEDAGLACREVTPFMKVRVTGLATKGSCKKGCSREGLITIWNPTEKQKMDLVEGQIYSVTGLMPLNYGTDILYLQARGSTIWKPLPLTHTKNFEPFFTPRTAVLLSNLGEVPLASEFDIAAVVLHVGDVYLSGNHKKQWIFLMDGSKFISELQSEELHNCLLAVSFRLPHIDDKSAALFNHTLSGSVLGFCNLVKHARDPMKNMWVAEATEYSTYSVYSNLPKTSHLKEAAASAEKWAKQSSPTIEKLRERVLCMVDGRGS